MKGFDLDAILPEERDRLVAQAGAVGQLVGMAACRLVFFVLDQMASRQRERTSTQREEFVSATQARKLAGGVTTQTLRDWHKKELVHAQQLPSGRWAYLVSDLLTMKEKRKDG